MKRSAHFPVVFILAGAAITAVVFLNAADKSVTLPKGTKVEKLGSSQFRFTLPDGRKAEVKGLNAKTGIIGDCGIYDKGKLVAKGGGGSLISLIDPDPPMIVRAGKGKTFALAKGELVNLQNLSKVPKSDYVMIDDEITWLPATVQFKAKASEKSGLSPQPDPPGLKTIKLPKGTKAEKLGAGHVRFTIPGAQQVEVNNFNAKTGIIGDCGIYDKGKLVAKGGGGSLISLIDPDPPMIVRAGKGKTYVLTMGDLVNLQNLSKVPKSDYVMIDDEITWLPATIRFN